MSETKEQLPSVYIETTIISYLASRPSKDQLSLAKQHLTEMWWARMLSRVRPFISEYVLREVE